ncbi:MAG: acylneuraminate cytidylyltransferase family protein [Candidatus Omnitrophica bacterium]|nr:acylneuraminate cytidylyltransferase family protein [Candidatus Omnitrophota bacterium]
MRSGSLILSMCSRTGRYAKRAVTRNCLPERAGFTSLIRFRHEKTRKDKMKKKDNRVLAVIPARGGSKGLRDKNIRPLSGKPLIGWVLREALKSRKISEVVVSTDSARIAEIAREYGAQVPFMRPKNLALDASPGIDPVLHLLGYYRDRLDLPGIVVCLQCTSPLTEAGDIDNAVTIYEKSGFDSLVSVTPALENPYWMVSVDDKNRIDPVVKTGMNYTCRQQIPVAYKLSGAIYVSRPEILLRKKSWVTDNTGAYVMEKEKAYDIDTLADFEQVEAVLSKRKK